MERMKYLTCCVNVTKEDFPHLEVAINEAREVSLKTFKKYVNLEEVSRMFGYAYGRAECGLRIGADWAVRFYKSKWNGKRCYYVQHSAIEYIFTYQD